MTIRVLIADDQALVRDGFGMILDAQPDIEVVGGAADGREAIEMGPRAGARRRADGHPDARGRWHRGHPAPLRRRRARAPRILMLTTFDQNEYLYEAMKAGAGGFLLKDVRREELVNAVRVIAAGDALLAPALTRRLIEDFVRRPPPGTAIPDAFAELTERETGVLRLVARGLSNAEIAERLVVSDATVKTHVARILSKLGLRDRIQVVVLAYESGFVQPGDG